MIQYRPGLYLVTSAVVRHSGAPSLVRNSDARAAFTVQHDNSIYKSVSERVAKLSANNRARLIKYKYFIYILVQLRLRTLLPIHS